MIYPIRFWAVLLAGLLLYQFSTELSADYCKYEKQIEKVLDLSSTETLSIIAVAGDLEVTGVKDSREAVIRGRVCASKEAWLEEAGIIIESGKQAQIEASLPTINGGWSLTGSSYVNMDLRIEVPQDAVLEIKDSSGDIVLKNAAVLSVQDSSGDIEIIDARHAVVIRDSSGDIDVEGSTHDVTIENDSSGDIYVRNIQGTFRVVKDSSGDIDAREVAGDVIVEKDSSGDIDARNVSGDFRVLKDGSGRITSNQIGGDVDIPSKG
jgi:hypothetical protein